MYNALTLCVPVEKAILRVALPSITRTLRTSLPSTSTFTRPPASTVEGVVVTRTVTRVREPAAGVGSAILSLTRADALATGEVAADRVVVGAAPHGSP